MNAMNLTAVLRGLTGGGIGGAITALRRAEEDLALALVGLSERHATDHEIHFVARDLAGWSREHVRRLAETGNASHGLALDPEAGDPNALSTAVKRVVGDSIGRLAAPSLLLLADLRDLHRAAAGVSLDWEVLAQSAQAAEHTDLIELAADCHPQTLRQLRWMNAQVKELAAQAVLAT
jgi:hypothetical protein